MPNAAISALLSPTSAADECVDARAWWPRWRKIAARTQDPFERAILGGAEADRLGWSFASGYQAALRVLDPSLSDDAIAALCVTEAEGNFPRAIKTSLASQGEGYVLNGEKRWTTLGPEGSVFLVIASEGGSGDDRPSLRAVRILSGTPGLVIEPMPPTAFVPEVPHARVKLDNVRVPTSAVLEGDGYLRYVKPFRTIEDIHVHAACIAYLVAEGRRRVWPQGWMERSILLLHALSALAKLDPLASQTHVALSAALEAGEAVAREADVHWLRAGEDPAAARWARDRKLFTVAARARVERLAAAWKRLDSPAHST